MDMAGSNRMFPIGSPGVGTPNARIAVAGPTTVGPGSTLIPVNTTTIAGASAIVLSSGYAIGAIVSVKDAQGSGGANPITITVEGGGTIDGGASTAISTNFGARILQKETATNWLLIGAYP